MKVDHILDCAKRPSGLHHLRLVAMVRADPEAFDAAMADADEAQRSRMRWALRWRA